MFCEERYTTGIARPPPLPPSDDLICEIPLKETMSWECIPNLVYYSSHRAIKQVPTSYLLQCNSLQQGIEISATTTTSNNYQQFLESNYLHNNYDHHGSS